MIKRIAIGLFVTLAVLGCGKKTKEAEPTETSMTPMNMSALPDSRAMKVVRGEMPPDTVIAQIGDTKLTAGTVKMLIEFRIASIINQIPPDRADSIKASMLKSTVEQFIEKSVLLNEADRRKIVATAEDERKALEEITKQLPPDVTIEQAIEQSPWGKKNLMLEMTASIKTKKLIDQLIQKDLPVTDEEADKFYETNKAQLDKPDRINVSHILIMIDKEDTAEIKAEKKKQLDDIRQKIADGADFADMAKQHSNCSSSKVGGVLGELHRESPFDPGFKDAAFKQKLNDLGPVVETQFGYHIIKITEKKPAQSMPREEIIEIVRRQKQGAIIKDFIAGLREKADIKYPTEL